MKVARAVDDHPILSALFAKRDSCFVTQAIDGAAHRGYQKWHRELDDEVVQLIRSNTDKNGDDFLAFLMILIERSDIKARFPKWILGDGRMFLVVNQKPSGGKIERYRTDFHYDDSVKKAGTARCPKCQAFVGMLEPVPPYKVRIETWGIGFGDLAFWLDDFLVTQRFADEYVKSGLRGLGGFVSIEVLSCRKHRKISEAFPQYLRTMPNHGSAKIDAVASGIDWGVGNENRCDVCLSGPGVLKRWKSVVVDESTWNGDDIFYAFGIPGKLIVSSRFASWATTHQFRNLILEDAKSSSHDFYPMETITPH